MFARGRGGVFAYAAPDGNSLSDESPGVYPSLAILQSGKGNSRVSPAFVFRLVAFLESMSYNFGMNGMSPIPDSPQSAPKSAVSKAPPTFAFMKDVLSACMKLTSDEIAHASRGGEAYFVSVPKGGARLVGKKEEIPGHAVGIDVEAAIRRSGIFGKDFPNLLPNDVIEHIVLGGSGKEEYDVRYADIKRREIKVSDLLRAAKESFKESDTVGEVTELFA